MQPTPDLGGVFAYVDAHRRPFLDRLFAYLRMPSISAHGQGIAENAAYLVDLLKRIGFDAESVPTAGWPVVVGRRAVDPARPTVMLYGHYDVQPPDPLDEWLSPPFEPVVRDGRIFARGVGDNKGQHFAQLLAAESLLAVTGRLPCNVVFVLEGEEEIGSPRMPDFVRDHRDMLRADLVVISDGPVHASGRSTITYGVRGVASFELRVRTARRDMHSGNWGGIAPNAIWRLVHLLATLKNERGEITIDGFYDNVQAPTELERATMAKLPIDEGEVMREMQLRQLDEPVDRPFFERTMFQPTLTINGLHGGYGGPGSKTVLPCEAMAKCDIRMVETQTAEEVYAKLEAHVRSHAPDVEVIRQGSMDPSKTPLNSPFAGPIRQGIIAAQGAAPLDVPSAGGSLPNYVFTRTLGIPVFSVPYGNFDQANHAPNENMEVERFFSGIRTGAAMLSYLGEASALLAPAPSADG